MQRFVFLISLLMGGFSLAFEPGLRAEEPFRLKVLSYNIHHGEGIDGKLDLERIARVIRAEKPDLVALQEVDRKVRRTNQVDQPAELARLTNMNVVFGGNIEREGGEYGNALLSRYPIARHKNHLLPNIDQSEQRGVIEAEITLPGELPTLLFLATHLDHRPDDRERTASAKAINQLLADKPSVPAILAGDLNDFIKSKTMAQFETQWHRANDQVLPTVPVKFPVMQIDYILVRPKARWKVIEVKVLGEAQASDHRAIFAELELIREK